MSFALWMSLMLSVPVPSAEKPTYPPLANAVSSFGAIECDGWLYVYGGHAVTTHQYATDSVVGTFQRLKLDGGTAWEPLPGGIPVQGLALVAHQGKLYRIGGMQPRNQPGEKTNNVSVADCARFDPATNKWEPLPDLPEGRSSHDAVVVGDRLVVVGGWRMNGADAKPTWHENILVLDLGQKEAKWVTLKQPFKRRALTATAFQDKVYIIGGMDHHHGIHLAVDIYDPATDDWSAGPDLPGSERNGFSPASCVCDQHLFVNTADGKVWRLSDQGDAWQEAGHVAEPRIVHRMIGFGERLVVVGGAAKQTNVARTESVTPKLKGDGKE